MTFQRHQYPPMLGPLEAVPAGTPEWAERLGLRILNAVETTEQHGVDRLIEVVNTAVAAEHKPWFVCFGPNGKPCRTPDRYLKYAAGINCGSVAKLIAAYKGEDDPLVRQLRRYTAEAEKVIGEENISPGRGGLKSGSDTPRLTDRGSARLLRRLARKNPDILSAYERGEFETPTAAARAAGVTVDTPPLVKLRRAWKHATPEERDTFLAEIEP